MSPFDLPIGKSLISEDDRIKNVVTRTSLDVAYTAVSGYELGTRQPDLLVLLRYARLAGVSTDVLIDDKLKLPD